MLMLILIILGIVLIAVPILKLFIVLFMVILPLILLFYVGGKIVHYSRLKKVVKTLDFLTSEKCLSNLKKEDKKLLAKLIYQYYYNYEAFNNSIKDDLLWAGIGYSVSTMGFDNAMRVGIGYTVLRRYVKPAIRHALDKKKK